jgi:uncharacterized membrane protein YphA (DoxX/SURF4 family)
VSRVLTDRRLTLALRVMVAAVLIYASYDKLLHPRAFADAVDNYRLLPQSLVNLVAIVLPWVELLTGVCLLTGLAPAGGGLLGAVLFAVFLFALVAALARGLNIGCGCFGAGDETGSSVTWRDLWLRAALLAASLQITFGGGMLEWPAAVLRGRRRASRFVRRPS